MRRSLRTTTALGATVVLAAGGGAAVARMLDDRPQETVTTTVPERSSRTVANATDSDALTINEIYRRTGRGVVEIKTTSTTTSAPGPFAPPGEQSSQSEGSGFVLDKAGHIATNQHVIADAESIEVTFANGRTADAEVVGEDASSDVAVIRVDAPASELEPLDLGDSSDVEVGDSVVAIGSPYGLEATVTTGIISALDRSITSPSDYTIGGVLQTDAAINPGNSGGALLDSSGRVIGMNAQIASSSAGNNGVGFAIPVDTVKRVADALISGEQVEHAYLGVSLTDAGDGAEVAEARDGSPAAAAGIEQGDVVVAIDGKGVTGADDLAGAIDGKAPGAEITLTIRREGEQVEVDVTLGTRPS